MKRPIKILLIVIGTLLVGLGFIGIFLPFLPTTPFLLLAAVCYSRSSDRLYSWLLSNRWFGQYIRDWREGRGIPLKIKILSVSLLILTIAYSVVSVVPSSAGKILLILVASGVSAHIISLPTKEGD